MEESFTNYMSLPILGSLSRDETLANRRLFFDHLMSGIFCSEKEANVVVSGMGVDRLPDNVIFNGRLELNNMQNLVALPSILSVSDRIMLRGCTSLVKYPNKLTTRVLNIQDCNTSGSLYELDVHEMNLVGSFPNIPHDTTINLLSIADSVFSRLPLNLHIKEQLYLKRCCMISTITSDVIIDGILTITRCHNMESLWCFDGRIFKLKVTGCPGLESFVLPKSCKNLKHVSITGDGPQIPDGMFLSKLTVVFTGHQYRLPTILSAEVVLIRYASSMQHVPNTWKIYDSISITSCDNLVSFGVEVVPNDLILVDNINLEYLPTKLRVGGVMTLKGSCTLNHLPYELSIGQGLSLENCRNITSLPVGFDQMNTHGMTVELYGSGIPLDVVELLVNDTSSNIIYMYTCNGGETPVTLSSLVSYWKKGCTITAATKYDESILIRFFTKLKKSSKRVPRERVEQLIDMINDGDMYEEIMTRINDSVDTCHDKPLWVLNQLNTMIMISKARGDASALRDVGRNVMALGIVHKHAEKWLESYTNSDVDDVCVYLKFEIELRDIVPCVATSMLFPDFMTITKSQIAAARADVLSITPCQFEEWLVQWEPWMRYVRSTCIVPYNMLPFGCTKHEIPETNVMGDDMEDPMSIKGGVVMSYDIFTKHWVEHGVDLYNTPIHDLQDIVRHR